MNVATLEAGIPWDFETFPEYLDSVERHGTALNYGAYVGHTAVRLFVMGDDGYEREQATDDEIAAMQARRERGARGRRGGLRDELVDRRTRATAAGRCRRGSPISRSSRRCSSRWAASDKGVAALLPGERIKHGDVYEVQRQHRASADVDCAADHQGLPVA